MVNKKAVLVAAIIAVIIVIVIVGVSIVSFNKKRNEQNNFIPDSSNSVEDVEESENSILNETSDNVIEEESDEENTDEEDLDEDIQQEEDTQTESDEEDNTAAESDEDIAINLAKKTWGETNEDVYYYNEEKLSEDEYVVSVRSKQTTAILMYYKVNIKTEEVAEY